MKLLEHQGKELFQKYGITVPKNELIFPDTNFPTLKLPLVLKAQVPSGNRKKAGGIIFLENEKSFEKSKNSLFSKFFSEFKPAVLLAEEKINFKREIYLSFSYDTDSRGPVLALSSEGGTGILEAKIFPIDLVSGLTDSFIRNALTQAGFELDPKLIKVIFSLWDLFSKEKVLLAEINPLFELENGEFMAGDAKIILDDSIANPQAKPFLNLGGDIAVIASGGGASLVNLDALIKYGGKPANYVEYSGNPSAESVKILTKRVLSRPGLKGCWVVGGTANFTDIYETMLGFVQGLKEIDLKPTYPIVIRRDGPRQKEAFEMLEVEGKKLGFDFHLYGPETPMTESAKIIVDLAYAKKSKK